MVLKKRILTAILAAAIAISMSSAMSGCQLKGHSPEDYYVSPIATQDSGNQASSVQPFLDESDYKRNTDTDTQSVSKEESKDDKKAEKKPESKAESKPESKAESKPESKAESKPESKAESKPESKAEPKPESKAEPKPESKAELKPESRAETTEESTPQEGSPIYNDMISLIKDTDVLGYTVTKIVGSEDDHLIIYYGKLVKKEDTDTSNLLIVDPEGYAKEQAEKENARREKEESSKLFSIYKIEGDRVIPEGDIDGYFVTAYISPNTNTLGMYYNKDTKWKYGLIEIDGSSAFANYVYEGDSQDENGTIEPMPGNAVEFSKPNNFDLLKKYK